ncbi:MAG: cytochrome c biogenesis protein CcsA [Actinomycetota bacterium]
MEIIMTWVTLFLYAGATALSAIGVVFSKEKLIGRAVLVSGIGLAAQTASLGFRWVRVGHGPYLGFYEVAAALVLFVVATFVFVAWRQPRLASAGIGVMPVALLLLGGAMLAQGTEVAMTGKLTSFWLAIHVIFANLAFGAFVISFGLAIAYIVRERSGSGAWAKRFEKLPAQDAVENLTVRYVLVGFFFWGIMIVTGAIWANEAWGRYWGWDPVETWSLIVWIIYAVYLHLRYTLKWDGQRLAWVAILAMPLSLFTLIGIPAVFDTTHAGIGGLGKDL